MTTQNEGREQDAVKHDDGRTFSWTTAVAVGVFVAVVILLLTRLGVNEWLACFLAGLLSAAVISVGGTLRNRRVNRSA